MTSSRWRTARRRTLGRLVALFALAAVVGWSLRAALAFGASEGSPPPAGLQASFDSAQGRFLEGRSLQRLHRNTPASNEAFGAALEGYEDVARKGEATALGARALYMSGSTLLFLDRPSEAARRYAEVADRYREDAYAVKALVRKAQVEKNSLDADAARRTVAAIDDSGALAGELDRIRRSLEVIGSPAAPLDARAWIGGDAVSLPATRGEVVLLYFFTTWCPNCAKEADFIRGLATRWQGSGVRIIAVTNHSRGQTDDAVAAYLERHGFDFPAMVDDDGRTSAAYRGGSVPTMAVVDRSGTVRWHDHPAALSDDVLRTLTAEAS